MSPNLLDADIREKYGEFIADYLKPDFSPYFSRDVENLSPNLSPCRREALIFPPSLVGKGVRGLGFSWTFPHDVKSQISHHDFSKADKT
jgi:hypothetical protein